MDWLLIGAASTEGPNALMGILTWLLQLASVGLGLGFVIFVHELGHFLVAKACGVKCEKFYVGFDFFELDLGFIKIPAALWKKQIGETEYGIGILPLGGYVKMLGQDDDPRNAEAEAERIRVGGGEANAPAALDPRSYPAKSVPARMAIISAGVIMNIITGVMIAAVAYMLGVTETPAVIGRVVPGDPAWKAGLAPGDKIIKIGSMSEPNESLRFTKDLTMQVIFNGADRPLDMTVRHVDGKEEQFSITPTKRMQAVSKRSPPTLGITGSESLNLSIVKDSLLSHFQPKTDKPIVEGDRVTEINGKAISNQVELQAWLAANPSAPLTLTVERVEDSKENKALPPDQQKRTTEKIAVEPQLRLGSGVTMGHGPIVAIRKGSPAETAGFKEGDKLVSIQGEEVGNVLSLGQRLLPHIGKPIEVTVERPLAGKSSETAKEPSTETVKLTVTPVSPHDDFESGAMPGAAIGVEPLGIALTISSDITTVSEGSPLQKEVKPGDIAQSIKLIPDDPKNQEKLKKELPEKWLTGVKLDNTAANWAMAEYMLSVLPDNTSAELTVLHSGVPKAILFKPSEVKDFYEVDRHLVFKNDQFVIQTSNLGTALQLGMREIRERVTEVFTIVSRLVTGRIAATNLSGPLGILSAAGASASRGPATLLMFFTLLSANLAVLNILPVPALDGGHLVFLVAEWIRGKPVDEKLQIRLTVGGVLCLLSLMLFATFNDLTMFWWSK